ncbi:glutathione-specific gamma-glutamylcyclotransferase 1-like [Brevipalpus obovatus]|uniref:glutathione-specific gamma-glutamylcyclotransferase 1-like n=1 Tax=Brevipalpus obovatus TaxID=246614 RepID=UPI003D9E8897
MASNGIWVFGYGSLLWNPGFNHGRNMIGYIKGYKRRFWQGNDTHRGKPERLGRVVTLVPDGESITWGRAYQVINQEQSREYLDKREVDEGGYETTIVEFHPRDVNLESFPVSVYIATPKNRLFLGPGPLDTIALDIAHSEGPCGHNVEYLARLSAFMHLINVWDNHVHQLERVVKNILASSNPQLVNFFKEALKDEAIRLLESLGEEKHLNDVKQLLLDHLEMDTVHRYGLKLSQILTPSPEIHPNKTVNLIATPSGS